MFYDLDNCKIFCHYALNIMLQLRLSSFYCVVYSVKTATVEIRGQLAKKSTLNNDAAVHLAMQHLKLILNFC